MTPSVTSSWKARRTVWRPSPVAVTISASVGSRCPAAYRPAAIAWRRSAATRRYALTWPGPTARNEVRTALASTGRLLLAVVIPGRVMPGRVMPGHVMPGRVVRSRGVRACVVRCGAVSLDGHIATARGLRQDRGRERPTPADPAQAQQAGEAYRCGACGLTGAAG